MSKPSREEAMQAVKTLIEWAGDDPTREGLVETPKRVVAAYEEFFEGYTHECNPQKTLHMQQLPFLVFLQDPHVSGHRQPTQ